MTQKNLKWQEIKRCKPTEMPVNSEQKSSVVLMKWHGKSPEATHFQHSRIAYGLKETPNTPHYTHH